MMEGFLVPYLAGIGYAEREIGLVMGSLFFLSVATTPLWGFVADRTGGHRWIISIALAVSVGAVLGIRAGGTTISLVMAFSLLYSLTMMSIPALIDSWLMAFRREGFTVSYEISRGFGSLGYSASGAVLGIVLNRFGLNLVFPIYAVVVGLVFILVVTMSGRSRVPEAAGGLHAEGAPAALPTEGSSHPPVFRSVLTNARYLAFVAATFLTFVGVRSTTTFLALRFYEIGGTTAHLGLAQSAMAGSEIPFMFLSVIVLRRFRPRAVILVALIVFVVRLTAVRLAPSPGLLIAAQVLQGPSIGFMLPASVHYIDRIAPAAHRSLFQTLAPAIYFGLASVVGSSAGGLIVGGYGLDALYTIGPIMAAAGGVVFSASLFLREAR